MTAASYEKVETWVKRELHDKIREVDWWALVSKQAFSLCISIIEERSSRKKLKRCQKDVEGKLTALGPFRSKYRRQEMLTSCKVLLF
jgi:hypothetical protein